MASTSALDSSSAASAALGSFTQSATGGSTLDKNSFLLLLVTQFKNQDPLNPMEDREFVAQLAQFSSLEQQMQTNANMETLVELQNKTQMLNAASYIGKTVSARGYGVSVMDGVVSEMLFAPSEEVVSCTAQIFDASGKSVTTLELGSRSTGIHSLDWNGRKADGGVAPNGVYTVRISGENAAGKTVTVDTSVSGVVVGVSTSDGEQILRLSDGRYVAMSNVRELVQSATSDPSKQIVTVSDGEATPLRYKLNEEMSKGNAVITDSEGSVVATVDIGKQGAGTYNFEWNAQDNAQRTVKDGDYTVTIEGANANGSAVLITYLGKVS